VAYERVKHTIKAFTLLYLTLILSKTTGPYLVTMCWTWTFGYFCRFPASW